MTVSASRILALRLADVRRRINAETDVASSIARGTHRAFRFAAISDWMAAHPTLTYSDFTQWRDEAMALASERLATLKKRAADVDRIAATLEVSP